MSKSAIRNLQSKILVIGIGNDFRSDDSIELSRSLNQLPAHLIVYGIEGKNFEAGKAFLHK